MKMITFFLILLLVGGISLPVEGRQTKSGQEITLRVNQQKALLCR